MAAILTASEMYATAHRVRCGGDYQCHWCGAFCSNHWLHDDPPPLVGSRTRTTARRPGDPFICAGCWLWRRPKITAHFLGGGTFFLDGQTPRKLSWLVTPDSALAVRREFGKPTYDLLLSPPPQFFLCLSDGVTPVHLHQAVANNFNECLADTEVYFTSSNTRLTYTPYELSEALSGGPDGREPGAQELVRFFGTYPEFARRRAEEHRKEQEKGRGRPRKDPSVTTVSIVKKVLVSSGAMAS